MKNETKNSNIKCPICNANDTRYQAPEIQSIPYDCNSCNCTILFAHNTIDFKDHKNIILCGKFLAAFSIHYSSISNITEIVGLKDNSLLATNSISVELFQCESEEELLKLLILL